MTQTKRATIYFEPELHAALRVRAAEAETTISELVNRALRQALAEDLEDLEDAEARVREPRISYRALLEDLRAHGKI